MKYRPEIDGLRSIAVLAVILYHADFSLFSTKLFGGGFTGVDIFFVISGYLITSIIIGSLKTDTFSFRDFYERRARRILPAFLVSALISLVFAWFSMSPKALQEFSQSVIASLVFASNFFFWLENSYTSEESLFKPFLHTWSLSVEEQFYIFFPIILWFVYRFYRKQVLPLFIFAFLFSLQLAEWGSSHHKNAAFYLLPTRVWELMAGAILAKIREKTSIHKNSLLNSIMPPVGLFLIFHGIFFYNDQMQYPSLLTIVPVLGTILLLWFGGHGDLGSLILSSRPFVGIGVISYSLYLFHQPVFAFARIKSIHKLTYVNKLYAIAIVFILASVCYYFVENPLRKRKYISFKTFSFLLFPIFVLVTVIALFYNFTEGSPQRLDGIAKQIYEEEGKGPEYVKMVQSKDQKVLSNAPCNLRMPIEACRYGDESWVVLGDSHAGVFEPSLLELLTKQNKGLFSLTFQQCPFVDGVWFNDIKNCAQINQERWIEIKKWQKPKYILLSASVGQFNYAKWDNTDIKVDKKIVVNLARENISKLLKLNHKIILIYPVPNTEVDIKRLLTAKYGNSIIRDRRLLVIENPEEDYKEMNSDFSIYDGIPNHPNLLRIYPSDTLCNKLEDSKKQQCWLSDRDGIFYNGTSHLSRYAVQKILQNNREALNNFDKIF